MCRRQWGVTNVDEAVNYSVGLVTTISATLQDSSLMLGSTFDLFDLIYVVLSVKGL